MWLYKTTPCSLFLESLGRKVEPIGIVHLIHFLIGILHFTELKTVRPYSRWLKRNFIAYDSVMWNRLRSLDNVFYYGRNYCTFENVLLYYYITVFTKYIDVLEGFAQKLKPVVCFIEVTFPRSQLFNCCVSNA